MKPKQTKRGINAFEAPKGKSPIIRSLFSPPQLHVSIAFYERHETAGGGFSIFLSASDFNLKIICIGAFLGLHLLSPKIEAMPKGVPCKFFAQGGCLKGEHCEFLHELRTPPNNICTYYQKGICAFGSRCRYEHVKTSQLQSSASSFSGHRKPNWNQKLGPQDSLQSDGIAEAKIHNPADQSICSFAAAGNCLRGEKCSQIHGDLCPTCGKQCLHPFKPQDREEHLKACKKRQWHLEILKHSQEIECSVCLERVLSKPTEAERKFGILSECDHPFCIVCIRNWRSSSPSSGLDVNSALRACPICRKRSYFVIPSVIWYNTKEEKQEIIDSYKAKLRTIDCKHFDFGNGTCPFGTSCFYKHTVKPGSMMWNRALMPDTFGSRYPDMDEVGPSSDTDVDGLANLFEHLYMPHRPGGLQEQEDSSDEELYEFAEAMSFLLLLHGSDTSDFSSDEE
nr:putative RING-type E3 ubiquitin transferase C3H69 isoform X1 [Ipomoea batatas]